MAFIDCPQCGQSALSVATRCPRCGFGFTQDRLRHGQQRRQADNRVPMWVAGGLAILIVVFLVGEGGNGSVTVPPIAGGLDEKPAEVVVQADSSVELATDSVSVQPAIEAPPEVAPTTTTAVLPARLDTVPPIVAAAPVESRPVPDPVVVTIIPPDTSVVAFPEERRWAKTWVNVRAGRSGSSEAVSVLNPGEPVGVDSLGQGWYRVLVGGVPLGYVDRTFLAPAPPDSLPS